jgi:hypothetical protein
MSTLPAAIAELGFTSVADFQAAWALGPRLDVDGLPGPHTLTAANISLVRRRNKQPDLSEHFSVSEFACHCRRTLQGCRGVLVLRDLLQSLELLRAHTGPLSVVSGYRCPRYNASLPNAAKDSQHQFGAAADIPTRWSKDQILGLHTFAGVGWEKATGHVVHVDRRDKSGHNPTHSKPATPATWTYPR